MQVSSATATFAMMFSSSIAVVEYYLLNRFPVPYGTVDLLLFGSFYGKAWSNNFLSEFRAALFFTGVAFFAAIIGQRVARKVINLLGRASFIIFILSSLIFVSAISLGNSLSPFEYPRCNHSRWDMVSHQTHS
jgi:hypothetical protein